MNYRMQHSVRFLDCRHHWCCPLCPPLSLSPSLSLQRMTFSVSSVQTPDTPALDAGQLMPVDLIAEATSAFPRRPSWDEYFMATAVLISTRSNCERLHVGCVIVTGGERRNRLVAAGF